MTDHRRGPRPNRRKVAYPLIVAEYNRCGSVTDTAATVGVSKGTVSKVLAKCGYTLAPDGKMVWEYEPSEAEVLYEIDSRPNNPAVADAASALLKVNENGMRLYGPSVAMLQRRVGAPRTEGVAFDVKPPKPMFFRDGDILMLNDGLLPLMGPGLIERAENEGFDPTPIAEAYRRLSPDEEDHYVPAPMPTKEEFEADMERERKKIAARLKALSANLNGKIEEAAPTARAEEFSTFAVNLIALGIVFAIAIATWRAFL